MEVMVLQPINMVNMVILGFIIGFTTHELIRGVPPNHPNSNGIFHYKPSILGYPHLLEIPIWVMIWG